MLGLRKTRLVWLAALVALAGCDDGAPAEDAGVLEDAAPGADTGPEADGGPPPTGAILARPSRSSTIAITDENITRYNGNAPTANRQITVNWGMRRK